MSALSKRQQARNERALQEMIRSVPGNDRCADCEARNPGWASWNLGIFLCLRCASLHRKLGTHVSKVKSLTMDSWTSDQVDNMKRTGNTAANKIYNPRNIKPPIPIDADEADSAMERFIRQKYESKILEDGKPKPPSRQDPSYITKSVDDTPPPLPPKPGKKIFGLRTSFGSSKSSSSGTSIGHQANKQSRTFGLSLNDGNGSFESKLTILRDMGFPDDRRNATILKGLNEDLDKAVETLVRLGEGPAPVYRTRSPVSRRTTPGKFSDSTENKPAAASTNPFDQLDAVPRPVVGISINQSASQSTPNSAVAPKSSYNPFDVPTSQPAASLEQSFQNLQVSQALFPNTTGGYPSQQGQAQTPRYQSMTPPVTTTLNSGLVASPAPMNGTYNPFFQSAPITGTSMPSQSNNSPTNPFFAQMPQQSVSFHTQPQTAHPQQMMSHTNNPYYPQHASTMPSYPSASPFVQNEQQPQQQLYQQSTSNPYATAMAPTGQVYQSPLVLQQQQQQQPFQLNHPSRMDKSSILALYNFSQPPPTIPEQPQQQPEQPQPQSQLQAPPSLNRAQSYPQPSQPFQSQTQPSSTTFDTKSRNPFGVPGSGAGMTAASQPTANPVAAPQMSSVSNNPFPRTHMSQESIDVGRVQSGRHSPDIFASLSARYA